MIGIAANLGHIPNLLAVFPLPYHRNIIKSDAATVGYGQPQQTFYKSCFARTVGANERNSLSSANVHTNGIKRLEFAKGFA